MYCTIMSAALKGTHVYFVCVEADISNGLPVFQMVGYLSGEVKEAKDRVRTALRNCGVQIPPKRITVNLSPAGIKKHGASFDLPISAAILGALGCLKEEKLRNTVFIGEVGLGGEINAVSGVLPIVLAARAAGYKRCVVPRANYREGAVAEGIEVIGVSSIIEVITLEQGEGFIENEQVDLNEMLKKPGEQHPVDFSDIGGQEAAKRAAEIAVSGFHHFLMLGPPGAGKTMIAKRIPTIQPELTKEECLEISKIYSIVGKLTEENPIVLTRPFRNPHHTITPSALIGGGMVPKPGEVTLAAYGVLFLDEFTEFGKSVLDVMRQPMEEREITITRRSGAYTYPANCLIVAAMNPCKCGYYPDMNKCTCEYASVRQYVSKISRPILERMDLCVEVTLPDFQEITEGRGRESSKDIRERVEDAYGIQKKRYRNENFSFNGQLGEQDMKKYCLLKEKENSYMEKIFTRLEISPRVYHKILKTSRTIADLDGSGEISEKHINEAVCYRMIDQSYWKKGEQV